MITSKHGKPGEGMTLSPTDDELKALFFKALTAWGQKDINQFTNLRTDLFEHARQEPMGLAARLFRILAAMAHLTALRPVPAEVWGPTKNPRHSLSLTFQGPAPRLALIPALEGLFTTLSQRLEQLRELNTDLPGDYVDRSKSAFTDALLIELERQGYHSPGFDRLIALRDAWDNGTLTPQHGSTPHEHQEETVHAAVHRHGRLPGTAEAGGQQGNPENPGGVRGRSPELGHRATSHPDRDITPCCVAAPVIRHRRYEGDRHSTTGLQGGPQGQRSGPCGPGGLCHIGDRRR